MKRFSLIVSIVLLGGSASVTQAGWTYGMDGRVWYIPEQSAAGWPRFGWAPGGFRPANPTYGYYYYGYPSPAYSQGQPTYRVPSAGAYGQAAAPIGIPRGIVPAAPVPAPWTYTYAGPAGQPFYRPAAPVRAIPNHPSDLSDSEKRAKRLSDELIRVTRERDEAQAELAMWTALGVDRDQIKALQIQLARLQADNSSLVHRNNELEGKLSWYVGPEREVKMPISLSGHVLAVDPRYSFVVLNIGEKQGVSKNGKLLVNRDGKLVGKLRVTTVDANSSIANILPDWKLADVLEGDQVIHQ